MKILQGALMRIKPSKEEESSMRTKVDGFLKKIRRNLKGAKAVLGGSGAKGTWLKNAGDADIFVCFDYKKFRDKSDLLADILQKTLKKSFKNVQRLHGSRDYFQIREGHFTFEIVPILSIPNARQAVNITDVSPLHSKWVRKHARYADDIRLMKQFCKSAGVYGAESYINGFSGYVCEVLVIHHKGFLPLVRAAAKWGDKVIVDPEKRYSKKNILLELNTSKTQGPLVIADPVQPGRNSAAAVSPEKFECFKEHCRQFLKRPSVPFFEEHPVSAEAFRKKKKGNLLAILDIAAPAGKRDVVGCKLLAMFEQIAADLTRHEFKVTGKEWSWDKKKKAQFYFMVGPKPLPKERVQEGPPLEMEKHAEIFRKKHDATFAKNGRIYANVKRPFTTVDGYFTSLMQDNPFECKITDVVVE